MRMNGRRLAIFVLAPFALAGCVSTVGARVSDEELIKSLVDDAMAALQALDIDTMLANYADTFESNQGGGTVELREFFERAKEQDYLDDLQVDSENMLVTVKGNKASAKPITLDGQFGVMTVEFDLEKIDGRWMVTYQALF